MQLHDIKQIPIVDYLARSGYKPKLTKGVNYWYYSPLRSELTPSFKVNAERNQWYDFGIGKGGNIIDLAEQLYKSSDVSYLIHQIGHNVPSVVSASPGVVKPKRSSATFENLQVLPLSHPALIRYLQDRCIDIEVAKSVCKEVHYRSTTNVILLLAFRTVVVVMSCAILSSRVALHRKTSAISMPTSQRRYVFFSRALLIFSHS